MRGHVFNIQRFSIHDGPGIRTTVFLKGCPLRCLWCHNPEGLKNKNDLQFFSDRCIGCESCFLVCNQNVHQFQDGKHILDRSKCLLCGKCVNECYAGALVFSGREMTPTEVLQEIRHDRVFYDTSGGGVTLSGGEPLMQAAFSREVLSLCRAEGIHTAVETCGYASWDDLKSLLPFIDLIMTDIKTMDAEKHEKVTGVSNTLILDNILRLSHEKTPLIIRVPLIPGINDNESELEAIAGFIQPFQNLQYLELLPYHPFGESKYGNLGMPVPSFEKQALDSQMKQKLIRKLQEYGLKVKWQ